MKKQLIGLCVALFGVMVVVGCSSSDDSSVNYDHALYLGPAGADMQDLYADWEKNVPMNAR